MITEIHQAEGEDRYLEAYGIRPEESIYFDIETTGFRASTSHLYMIGYAVRTKEQGTAYGGQAPQACWRITQLMAESTAEEEDVLRKFALILEGYGTVIHFNGDRFDIPYLAEKFQIFGIRSPFDDMNTIDIYRCIRPYRKILGMERLSQKSVEQFLGIRRKDPYNGGQLIDVYRSVRDGLSFDRSGDIAKLMLHNYEDVCGMFQLSRMLAYPLIEEVPDEAFSTSVQEAGGADGPADALPGQASSVSFTLKLPVAVPVRISVPLPACDGQLTANGQLCVITAKIREGEMLHFLPDHQDYYYLPLEDTAIHRSVAQYVDREHRVKAKAETCFVKRQGRFLAVGRSADLPFIAGQRIPVFRMAYRDRKEYIEWDEEVCRDSEFVKEYLRAALRQYESVSRRQ